jgi:hypothetical protein
MQAPSPAISRTRKASASKWLKLSYLISPNLMTNPKDCACHDRPTAKPEALELAKLEAVLADCKRRKKAAGVVAPAIACMTEAMERDRRGLAVEALTAKLQAVTAQAKADLARIAAKSAAAAVVAPRPPVKVTGDTSRSARRDAARTASMLTATTAGNFSDALISQAAVHRSSPESDRKIATAELQRRGFSVHANGIVTKSTRR